MRYATARDLWRTFADSRGQSEMPSDLTQQLMIRQAVRCTSEKYFLCHTIGEAAGRSGEVRTDSAARACPVPDQTLGHTSTQVQYTRQVSNSQPPGFEERRSSEPGCGQALLRGASTSANRSWSTNRSRHAKRGCMVSMCTRCLILRSPPAPAREPRSWRLSAIRRLRPVPLSTDNQPTI